MKKIFSQLIVFLAFALAFALIPSGISFADSSAASLDYYPTLKKGLAPTETQLEAAGFAWKTNYNVTSSSGSLIVNLDNSEVTLTQGSTNYVTVLTVKSTGAVIIFYAFAKTNNGAIATKSYITATSGLPNVNNFALYSAWGDRNASIYSPSKLSDLFIQNGYIATKFTDHYGAAGTNTYYLGTAGFDTTPISGSPKAKTELTKPTAGTNSFTYTGSLITYTPSGYDSSTMSLSNYYAKASNTYTATIGIKDTTSYMWTDGTSDSFTLSWKITPATLASLSNGTNGFPMMVRLKHILRAALIPPMKISAATSIRNQELIPPRFL
jgi:hypothetical protein